MRQQSLAASGFERFRKKTRNELFLEKNGSNHPLAPADDGD